MRKFSTNSPEELPHDFSRFTIATWRGQKEGKKREEEVNPLGNQTRDKEEQKRFRLPSKIIIIIIIINNIQRRKKFRQE